MSDRGSETDAVHIRRAIELAARGWGRVAPNPLVGAVIVRDGRVVGEGWHREYGGPHAEVDAIEAAGEATAGATMYVSLEPCAHRGKTGPCVDAIREAGIRRVVYASSDPDPAARGGAGILAAAGIETLGGLEDAAGRRLNRAFFHRFTETGTELPWVELKLALSLDGRIADASGASRWITGEAARAEVHHLRAGADAVAVGIGTVLADDPSLTVRGPVTPRVPPVRVVFDRTLRLPVDGRLALSAAASPVWVFCSPAADETARARIESAGMRVIEALDLRDAMRKLKAASVHSVFCEGGARIASALLRADLVDRLTLLYAPFLVGPGGIDPFHGLPDSRLDEVRRWNHVRTASLGADSLICVER